MPISTFDLFSIGIGPSSSHTVGPMRAAGRFLADLDAKGALGDVARVQVTLFGSLALTGKGHATDKAIILGLAGERPETVDPDAAERIVARIQAAWHIDLLGRQAIAFITERDLIINQREKLPEHSNGMIFEAFDDAGNGIAHSRLFSIGGGFVVDDSEIDRAQDADQSNIALPYDFDSGDALLRLGRENGLSICQMMLENEKAWRDEADIRRGMLHIADVMEASITRGCAMDGILPGGLKVRRRAPDMFRELVGRPEAALRDPLTVIDWVNLYALAVNEENAAGGRVVTAPTNGAAGVIPAVLTYYRRFVPGASDDGVVSFLLTSAAIGMLYKKNASISAAEVGCQGEVGVACSMAAGALCGVMGGSNAQIENAAEIGMEHNLGLTCDPIAGLVQIPCIERNTMGAVKAINAARLALRGDGKHFVSLDKVIQTMRDTGRDMSDKYKETAQGGLAVNVVAC